MTGSLSYWHGRGETRGPALSHMTREMKMNKGHVLVIDDEDLVRTFATRVLNKHDYTVTSCVNGEAGVAKYREIGGTIDLVICDMVMPGIGGREVFKQIRGINPDALVLLISGFSVESDVNSCLKEGAAGYLPKPYDIDSLISAVRALIEPPKFATA